LQEVLEMFEFFPIKCRIQRALEVFQANRARLEAGETGFKSKVCMYTIG
jgi:hypothetical protein